MAQNQMACNRQSTATALAKKVLLVPRSVFRQLSLLVLINSAWLGLSTQVMALDTDRSKSITITADYAELDEGAGTATYRGKVELTQGSLKIHSDRIVVLTNSESRVEKVIATGSPASFSQKLDANKPEVVAKANDIEYQPSKSKLILSHRAELTQGENQFEGERIEYDIKLQILNATGDTSSTESNRPKRRVKMVLPPPLD